MRRGIVFALPLLPLFVSAALLAQVTSSSIFGTVTDTTGAVVPGVEIKVTQQETNFTRTFKFGERFEMQFRAEATNAFNMVNLRGPNTTLTSSAFGTINEAEAMRELQLGMRFAF